MCDNFTKADGQTDFVERSKFIQKHSKLLKKLAFQFELTVIILNNVVAEVSLDSKVIFLLLIFVRGFSTGKRQEALSLLWVYSGLIV